MNGKLPERMFICGFMGAGKSTIGRRLARKLDRSFYDLDDLIKEQANQSIAEIFSDVGEQEFRRLEKTALLEMIRQKKGVIALGGGSLHNQHVLDHLKVNGLLIFIDTPMEAIIKRICRDKTRPLLLNDDGTLKTKQRLKKEMQQLYQQRLPFYRQAEVSIQPTNDITTDEIVETLAKKIKYHVALH